MNKLSRSVRWAVYNEVWQTAHASMFYIIRYTTEIHIRRAVRLQVDMQVEQVKDNVVFETEDRLDELEKYT